MRKIKDLVITEHTHARLYEIAFNSIMENITLSVGNDNMDMFLELFCKIYKIDFTSLNILRNMYASKIKPTKRELALFGVFTAMQLKDLPMDYRTLRKYRKEWVLNGYPQLQPLVINEFLKPVIKAFVDSYMSLMFDNVWFVQSLRKAVDTNVN